MNNKSNYLNLSSPNQPLSVLQLHFSVETYFAATTNNKAHLYTGDLLTTYTAVSNA